MSGSKATSDGAATPVRRALVLPWLAVLAVLGLSLMHGLTADHAGLPTVGMSQGHPAPAAEQASAPAGCDGATMAHGQCVAVPRPDLQVMPAAALDISPADRGSDLCPMTTQRADAARAGSRPLLQRLCICRT